MKTCLVNLIGVALLVGCSNSPEEYLPGTWTCKNARNQGMSLITFAENGSLKWIDDPDNQRLKTHRIGIYRIINQALEININEIPELMKLGMSSRVSIGEGAKINSIGSKSLQFTWWQNSEPNDQVLFNCKK